MFPVLFSLIVLSVTFLEELGNCDNLINLAFSKFSTVSLSSSESLSGSICSETKILLSINSSS